MNKKGYGSYQRAMEGAKFRKACLKKLISGLTGVDNNKRCLDEEVLVIGHSFINHIVELCEALLNAVCWKYSTELGEYPFVSLKDLFKIEKSYPIPFTPETRLAAKVLMDIKKAVAGDKQEIDTGLIEQLLMAAKSFTQGLTSLSYNEDSSDFKDYSHLFDIIFEAYDHDYRYFEHMNDCRNEDHRDETAGVQGLGFLFHRGDVDEDKMTEEELDEFYRIRNKNSNKHIAILEIIELFKREGTSRDHRLGVLEVKRLLEQKRGISIDRKTVARNLVQLQEADFLCQVKGENGYWYDSKLAERRYDDDDYDY